MCPVITLIIWQEKILLLYFPSHSSERRGLCQHRLGHSLGEKVARNEKRKKKRWFSYLLIKYGKILKKN